MRNEAGTASIRTPDQRLRVFISSTMKELAAERAAARDAVRGLRLTPVLFELGARPHPPRDLYRAYLEQSDVFVGVYAREYGWVAPDMIVSGIEDEYQAAHGMPRLVYVRAEKDRDPRLQAMLDAIASSGEVSYKRFASPEELRELLADDLSLLVTERFQGAPREEQQREGQASHLPSYATSLVGREEELVEIEALFADGAARLLTLTGPGGTGKTRLAVEAARRLAVRFPDGAQLVPLDALRDASLFASALASALGVQEFGQVRLLDTVKAQIQGRKLLLVLDNFEQIIAAAADVSELVRDLPALRVMVTSREPLRVSGEREFPVRPLDTETADGGQPGAVRLFLERARAVRPDLEFEGEDFAAVSAICRALDGLPLAIELAAARVRVLSPAMIQSRLAEGLDVLTGGARDAPQRQKTMRGAIAWSYDLLDAEEQRAFRCLAVFSGGFTLSAAEAVCGEVGGDVLEVLASLVAKSLLRTVDSEGDEPRFAMLEMIREFAWERLGEAGESEQARDEHCAYFAGFAKRHELTLVSPQAPQYRFVFEQEYPNLREAVQWAAERASSPGFDPERLTRLLFFLYFFWYMSGRLTEGHDLSRRAADATAPLPGSPARAAALFALGAMMLWQGDFPAAAALGEESLAIWRRHDRPHDTAIAQLLPCLASLNVGDVDRARLAFNECLDLLRKTGDETMEVIILLHLGDVELRGGDREAARRLYEEGLALQQRLGAGWPIAALENNFGELARYDGRHEEAEPHYRTALQWFEALESHGNIARTQHSLGYVALRRGDVAGARELFRASLDTFRKLGNRRGSAECVQGLATVAAASGEPEKAARLLGASHAALERLSAARWPADEREHDRDLARVVEAIGEQRTASAIAEGRELSLDQAWELAGLT